MFSIYKETLHNNTPSELHEFINEFLVGTPEDSETPTPPIADYEVSSETEAIGAFMMYCSACGYFTI